MNTDAFRTQLPGQATTLGTRQQLIGGKVSRLLLSAFVALIWETSPAAAQTSPLVPEFTGEHVYVIDLPDQYGPLREDITRLERTSPETYYVIILRTTGPGRTATRSYLEGVVEQWKSQAQRKKLKFDGKRSVVIVLAIEKREIIVLGGEELQERFGFRDPYIERDLLQPHFFAYARSGDYLRGLRVLVGQIDRWIADRDTALARRREEAAARDARLKGDAETALAGTKRLLEETRKELATRKAAGLSVPALDTRARQAADDLDTASRRLETSAGEALQLSQQAQRDLQGVIDQLRHISARQAELGNRLQSVSALSGEVLKAIEKAEREGLPAAPVQSELDEANKLIEQAGKTIQADPDQAERLVDQINRQLRDALSHARKLPDLRRQVDQKARAFAPLEQSTSAAIERARRDGISLGDIQKEWDQARNLLDSARKSAGSDDRKALADFTSAESIMSRVNQEARTRLSRHRVYTRTLPLTLLGIIGLIALGAVSLLWLRKRHLQGTVDKQFKGFREKAVSLMDQLDSLRQRHKSLPTTDPDFTQPLSGASLTLYNEIEADLNGLWDRWLKVMGVWDEAQKLVRSGSGLAVAETEEAKKLLEKEGNFDEVHRQVESCKERLDRLNQGHERARDGLKAGRDELAESRKSLQEVAAAGLPTDLYQKEIGTVETLFTHAEGLVGSDPIGASEVIARSREALRGVVERVGQVLTRFGEAKSVNDTIEDVAAGATKLRLEGAKLIEDQANPDPRLEEARQQHAAALTSLKQADPVAAGQRIDHARSAVGQARQAIERHLQAREACRKELPARLAAAREIHQALNQTGSVVEELRRGFASESWSDVAGNLDQARTLLGSVESRIAQAEKDASDQSQNYLHAASSLANAAADQSRAEQLLRAVVDRHRSLIEVAQQARDQSRGLEAEIRRVETFFAENQHAIGPEARGSLEKAEQVYRELTGLMAERLPNWPAMIRRIETVHKGCGVAIKQGQEDVDGFRQLLQKLEQVRQKSERVGALLQHEEKDRPPANQRYRAAVAALSAFQGGGGLPAADWDSLLNRLNGIEGDLDRAESLAHEDISLANGAIAELSEADRAIRSARAYYTSGVTVDVSEAEARIARARGALASQAYEQAIQDAQAAEQAANQAYQAAAHEARIRRLRYERGQVFSGVNAAVLIAAAQAAAESAGRWVGSGGISFPSGGSGGVFGSSGGGGDQGSGGGTDQGDWTSGADQANW